MRSKYYPGSCLLISESLSIERHSVCIDIENNCQLLDVSCCLILCKHSRLAIVSVYRSPSTDVKVCLTELSNVFEQLLPLTKYVVVVGELNIDLHKNTGIQKTMWKYYLIFSLFSIMVKHHVLPKHLQL